MINHFLDLVLTALTQNATPTNRIVHSKINEKRLNRLCKKCCFVVGVFFFFFFFFFCFKRKLSVFRCYSE